MPGDRKRGFSLIEVMIAMVILSVGLLALARMQGYFAQGSGESRYLTRAVDVGMSKLEELKNSNFESSALNNATNPHNANVSVYSKTFDLVWNVNRHRNCKKITLTVSWESGGDTKSVTLNGLVSEIE